MTNLHDVVPAIDALVWGRDLCSRSLSRSDGLSIKFDLQPLHYVVDSIQQGGTVCRILTRAFLGKLYRVDK